jgi:hypothetical protein
MDDFRAEVHRAQRTNEWDRVAFWLMRRFQSRSELGTSESALEVWKGIRTVVDKDPSRSRQFRDREAELARYLSVLSRDQTTRVQSILASLLVQVR